MGGIVACAVFLAVVVVQFGFLNANARANVSKLGRRYPEVMFQDDLKEDRRQWLVISFAFAFIPLVGLIIGIEGKGWTLKLGPLREELTAKPGEWK